MATSRRSYALQGFSGENNRDGETNQRIFGARGGKLRRLRNYHLIGYGRALKRRGYQTYNTALPNGSGAVQSMTMTEWGGTRELYVVRGGVLSRLNGTPPDATWDNVTGSVTISSSQDVRVRWGHFSDGTDNWLLGADGVNEPFAIKSGASAVLLSSLGAIPTPAVGSWAPTDVVDFNGHLFGLDDYTLNYTAYGTFDWLNGGAIDTQRMSLGVGLSVHSRNVLLVFYQHSVWQVEISPHEGTQWRARPVSGADGCISRDSIVTKDGYTYWAGPRGIYRYGNGGAILITGEIQDYWDSLNQNRRKNIYGMPRPSPWTEVAFLVTSGATQTQHNATIMWNDRVEGATIFPRSLTSGRMEFNCGCIWRDAALKERTLVGGYNGEIWEAWGTASADSSTTDGGATVTSEMSTGYLDFGYHGIIKLREILLDGETADAQTFTLIGEAGGKVSASTKTLTMGTGGDLLDVSFILDESFLSGSTNTQAYARMKISGRYVKVTLRNGSTGEPHVISALVFSYLLARMRGI